MDISKAMRRERKIQKRRYGPRIDSKSVFTIVETQKKRSQAIKKQRQLKELQKEDGSEI
jgi:hypothetical protein